VRNNIEVSRGVGINEHVLEDISPKNFLDKVQDDVTSTEGTPTQLNNFDVNDGNHAAVVLTGERKMDYSQEGDIFDSSLSWPNELDTTNQALVDELEQTLEPQIEKEPREDNGKLAVVGLSPSHFQAPD